jgi:hypothetical protein
MQIGDSFLAQAKESTIRVRASTMGRKLDRAFSVRLTPEGIRVWRIE